MDGRTQVPVINWLKHKYGVEYVDAITEPGPNKILAEASDSSKLESIKQRVDISINKHQSKVIAIVGHHDCAGNPVTKERQLAQIRKAIETIKSWVYNVDVLGLGVGESWDVRVI